MNMNIGFSADESYVSTSLPLLKPWDIYDVKFDGCEYTTFAGKKDPTATFEVLKIKFVEVNGAGQYIETLFSPKAGDEKRPTRKNKEGHEVEGPSNLENFQKMVGHFLTDICPEALPKLAGKSLGFKTLADFIVKATDPKKGQETQIKLIGDKNGRARSPYMLSVFENGKPAVITNNWIGKNLGFTAYELTQKEKQANAAPTDMASTTRAAAPSSSPVQTEKEDDLDFDL